MNRQERKVTFSLASIYAFRMLGLFMILPIFSLYAPHLRFATPTLIGFALGIYGLTQALLQLPLGMISDRLGRKPVLIFGLILFLAGSIIAALSHNIYGIILGRAVQGAGAIGSTLIAFLADSTDDSQRMKAMAMIGMTIGLSFIVAMVLGPILNDVVGLSGIFWFTALLAGCGVFMVLCLPTPTRHVFHRDAEPVLSLFTGILKNPELLRLDFGIFALHATLTALFIVVPMTLVHQLGMVADHQWVLYLPVLVIACACMFPLVIISEAKRCLKPLFIMAIAVITISTLGLSFAHKLIFIAVGLCVFFIAFTFLEASLPSLISKIAPVGSKGTAMGVYSSAQFLGIFVGGTLGGFILSHCGMTSIYYFCAALGGLWFLVALGMRSPKYLSSKIVKLIHLDPAQLDVLEQQFLALKGVHEAMIAVDEKVAYLKVDKKEFDEAQVSALGLGK